MKINEYVLKLWKCYHDHKKRNFKIYTKLMPLLYPPLSKGCLLFIGINPSFKVSYMQKMANHVNETEDLFNFIRYNECENKDRLIEKIIDCEKYARSDYIYFRKFKEIGEEVCLDWEHLDLFFVRTKNQKEFENICIENRNQMELSPFAQEQVDISFKAIKAIKPKIIVVANALASKIIIAQDKFEICSQGFNDYGYDKIKIDRRKVPIFFSGMINGQHALDNGSRNRLVWHIKEAKRDNNL